MIGAKQKFGMGRVYLRANSEAMRRGDRRVGTEHVLLALLVDPTATTAPALGIGLSAAREALDELDHRALAAIGLTAPDPGSVFPGREAVRLPMTPATKAVFTGLRKEAKGERLGVERVLLTLLSRTQPDPAAELLDALGIDRTRVRARLQELR